MLGHFSGERPWLAIEDLVNKQSGVLVGKQIKLSSYIAIIMLNVMVT